MSLRATLLAVLCALPLAAATAHATASITCEIEDKTTNFAVQGVVSHGVGETVHQLTGELSVKAKGVPEDFGKLAIESGHLTQSWLYKRELKLRFFRTRADGKPPGSLELIIEGRRKSDDELDSFRGRYELVVGFRVSEADAEEKTIKLRGKVSCSVG